MRPESVPSALNIALKAAILLFLLNLLYIGSDPLPILGQISAYNTVFPGRLRLPYGDNPERAYNLSLYNLDAMFASHEIAAENLPGEYRVVILGDSSTWGFLLHPGDTLASQINRLRLSLPDGRIVRAYNLGYPVMSLTKDLLILTRSLQYQPDMIVWSFTLESFPYDKQLFPPLLANNLSAVAELVRDHQLTIELPAELQSGSVWMRSIPAQRRELADLLRLQLYGVMWAATGIDQDIPAKIELRQEDLSSDPSFHGLQPPHLEETDLALEVIDAGLKLASAVPVLLVNEPVFISQGQNSDIRYNFYYPRWAFDDYRQILSRQAALHTWNYLDLWDVVPSQEFTNTAIHLTPNGTRLLAEAIAGAIEKSARSNP